MPLLFGLCGVCFVWGDASALDSVDSVLARVQCVNCRIVLRLVNSGPVQLDVTLTVSTMCVRSGVCHSNEAYHSVRLNLKPQCTLPTRAGWIPTLVYIKSTASERGTESGTWTIVVHHTTSSRTTNVFVATPGMPTPDVAQSKGVRSAACEAVCGRPWSRRRCGTARSWVRCSAGRRHSAQWVYGGAASCQQWRRLPARSHDAAAMATMPATCAGPPGNSVAYPYSHPAMAAVKRVNGEWAKIERDPIPGVTLTRNPDTPMIWNVAIEGPAATPYEGGVFHVQLQLPADYPFKPFELTLRTKIYNPHVLHGSVFRYRFMNRMSWRAVEREGLHAAVSRRVGAACKSVAASCKGC